MKKTSSKIDDQCIISFVKNEKTYLKLICGCNANNFLPVINRIEQESEISTKSLYDLAIELGLGCEQCLIVMDENECYTKSTDKVPHRYRQTFHLPEWNPRWNIDDPLEGKATNVKIINKDFKA